MKIEAFASPAPHVLTSNGVRRGLVYNAIFPFCYKKTHFRGFFYGSFCTNDALNADVQEEFTRRRAAVHCWRRDLP